MSKIAILKKAAAMAMDALKSPKGIAIGERISKRTGLDAAKHGAAGIASIVRNDPLIAGMVLLELGSVALPLLEELKQIDPDTAAMIDSVMDGPVDVITEDTNVGELFKFNDEFGDVSTAVNFFGSMERFLAVRRALTVDISVIALYTQTKAMGRSLS